MIYIDFNMVLLYHWLMSFSIGIIGLPNVGKSTIFKTLTKKEVKIAPRPFTTIKPNIGKVSVPDGRLKSLNGVIGPEKVTPTTIEFVDIAGLVKGAHKGEGLGNQFLAQIRNCDAVLQIVRVFDKPEIENILGEINPEKEIEIINVELLMKDLETLENSISKIKKRGGANETIEKIKKQVIQGKLVSQIGLTNEEKKEIQKYQLLTSKPIVYILNTNGKTDFPNPLFDHLLINLKEEEEILELSEQDKESLGLKSQLDKVILSCYDILNLISFFTVTGGKEVKAWTLTKGLGIKEAGGVVHSDFMDKFIRAEVVNWNELVSAGSWQNAKKQGFIKTMGKDYVVKDGDVIEFKI
jgi:GTP-binding protein YchF